MAPELLLDYRGIYKIYAPTRPRPTVESNVWALGMSLYVRPNFPSFDLSRSRLSTRNCSVGQFLTLAFSWMRRK